MLLNAELLPWIVAIGVIIAIIPYVLFALLYRKYNAFVKQHGALRLLLNGKTIDESIDQCINEVKEIQNEFLGQQKRLEQVEMKLRSGVDRVEVIRFNAFDHMSNDLSFVVAMLNQEGDGILLTSINNRDDSRVYAKAVSKGECTYQLMDEEKMAIEKAKKTVTV